MVFPMFALQTPTAYISQLSEPSQAEGILQYLHVQVYITYSAYWAEEFQISYLR